MASRGGGGGGGVEQCPETNALKHHQHEVEESLPMRRKAIMNEVEGSGSRGREGRGC